MLNSVISLVLAASLSSSELGTFFDLPDWMPREVSSHDTPGSDPQDGTGWYVTGESQFETARITRVTHFSIVRCYNDGIHGEVFRDVTKEVSQPTWDSDKRAWYVADSILPEDKGTDEPEYAYGYNQNTSEFDWGWWLDRYTTASYTATADRTAEDRYYKTAQGTIPRSFRLTPEILAAFNSTFEAYCERMYYTSCGQSNVWDSAYGPIDLRHFDFSKGGLYDQIPSSHSGKYPFYTNFNFSPSNRVINTRRLVDYTNIYHLFHWMCNLHLHQHWMTRIFRPSWREAYFSNFDDDDDCDRNFFHWFTKQDGGNLFANPGFVDFTWSEKPYTNDIRNAVLTFGSIERSDPDGCNTLWADSSPQEIPSDWHMRTEGYSLPLKRAFSRVYQLGKNDPERHLPKTSISNIGFKHLLQYYFPHSKADGWSLYNPTRRRLSEGLCEANQILSLMDRTYKNVPMENYGVISNFDASAGVTQYAEVPILLHVSPIQNRAWIDEAITPELVAWTSAKTNLQYLCYEEDANPDHLEYRFGGIAVGYSPAESMEISVPIYLSLSDIQQAMTRHFRRPDYYEILIHGTSVPISMQTSAHEGNDVYSYHDYVYPSANSYSNVLRLTVSASKAAFVKKTMLPSIKCSPFTFPGRDALPFVEDNQLFALMSILQTNDSGDREFFCGKSYQDGNSYTVRSSVPNLLMNKMSTMIDDALDEYNLKEEDLTDLPSLVECDPSMLKIAKENFYFGGSGSLGYSGIGSEFLPFSVNLVVRLSADLDFISAYMTSPYLKHNITQSELENGIEIGRCGISFENLDPQAGGDPKDIPGTMLKAKCSFVQKIDWNWKALHRTDD